MMQTSASGRQIDRITCLSWMNPTESPGNDPMKRAFAILFAFCSIPCLFAQMGNMAGPTFTRDVAPILQKNCQSCHRPGEAGPSLMLTHYTKRAQAAGP